MGILFAVVAILAWGVGDFLIQRSTRQLGDWEALFFITAFATIVLFPFVYAGILALSAFDLLILLCASITILFGALIDFEALRVGKISIVQPIYAMEMPITIALATFVIGEHLSGEQLCLIAALLVGVILISHRRLGHASMKLLERGVWYALLAAVLMGFSNFLFGVGARATGALMINWFTSAFIALATLLYLLHNRRTGDIPKTLHKHGSLILWVSLCDTLAWIAYSASMLTLPIGLATGLTESYIALSVLLGIILNKEKLRAHQTAGLALAVCAAILLGFTAIS